MSLTLTPRLMAAAYYVRQGSVAADVGTDHAYLPIYLVQSGICPKVIATDINEGPIERAKMNIEKYSLSENIITNKCNGLFGIEEYKPEDIIICGMGGELICSILEKSDYIRSKGIRLILQPMTSEPELYIWLCANGFNIIGERYEIDSSKCYRIICAEYTGQEYIPEISNAYVGTCDGSEAYKTYFANKVSVLERRIAGLNIAGRDAGRLKELYSLIKDTCKGDN